MPLTTKPDLDRVQDVWNHFWAGEMLGRPPVVASVTKPGMEPFKEERHRYQDALEGRFRERMESIDRWLESTIFLAEEIPFFIPDFGPDQYAAFFGGTLEYSPDSPGTNWIEPWVENWDDVLPLKIDESNPLWRGVLEYSGMLAEHARGRYLVGGCDLHSNLDALSAMRGPERMCMDLYDCPDRVEAAMRDIRKTYGAVCEALYEAGEMAGQDGTIGWLPLWSPGRFGTIQCDAMCLLSPEFNRRLVLPALEEEAASLDHCAIHFDGPGALPHLDDVLAIEAIDVIQWVSGAGQRPMHEWTDVLLRCQKASKGVQVYGVNPDQVRSLHPTLNPARVVYCVEIESAEECQELLAWLDRNS